MELPSKRRKCVGTEAARCSVDACSTLSPKDIADGRAKVVMLSTSVQFRSHKYSVQVQFMFKASNFCPEWDKPVELPKTVLTAVQWCASVSAMDAANSREQTMERIEALALRFRTSGLWSCACFSQSGPRLCAIAGQCSKWLDGCDEKVKSVSRDVNGPLLEALASVTDHCDPDCIEFFR